MQDKTAPAAYATSGFVMYLGTLDWNTITMVGGLVLGILTFGVNWYYKGKNARTYERALMKGVQLDEPKE